MANATITRLPDYYRPWTWSLKVTSAEQDVFHDFIESLKSSINYRKRKWDPTGKRWLFHDDALEDVMVELASHKIDFDFDMKEERRNQSASERPSTALMTRQQAAAELYLLPDAPADVVTAVFRVLAKQYHPDTGGTTEKMQRLNAAMEVLR